jgi:DNA-binding MarR family transcriptional regulator
MSDSADRHVARWAGELEWLDPIQEAIAMRITIASKYLTGLRRDTLAIDELARGDYKVLLMLRRVGPPYTTSPSRLADMLGLTRGALSVRLGPLEEAGLIERTVDAYDRRRVHVRLTEPGNAVFEQHSVREDDGEARMLSRLTAQEKQQLADLLRKVITAIEGD